MLAGSESDLQRMMNRLNMASVNYNMKINTKKTKVLRVSKGSESDNEDSSCKGNYRTSQGILLLRKHDLPASPMMPQRNQEKDSNSGVNLI